jgi:hypothetical protein
LNILLDQSISANHIFAPDLKNRHFLLGFVDVDEDGLPSPSGAAAFSDARLAVPITMDLGDTTDRHHRADIEA